MTYQVETLRQCGKPKVHLLVLKINMCELDLSFFSRIYLILLLASSTCLLIYESYRVEIL
jgi:hypothetical protein